MKIRGKIIKKIRRIETKELGLKGRDSAMIISNLVVDEKNNEVSCEIKFNYNENDRGEMSKKCTYYLDQLLK